MGISTPNADSAKTLPLFRPEALAARENLHGEVLGIHAFSPAFLVTFFAVTAITALVFLSVAKYEPTAKAWGEVISLPKDNAAQLEATFDVPLAWTPGVHNGSHMVVHCSGCKRDLSFKATITKLSPVQRTGANVVSPNSEVAGAVSRVTVALSPLNSLPVDLEQLHQGAKLEAEFPLESRPLIRLLTGALVP